MRRNLCTVLLGLAISMCLSLVAFADPIDGRDILKFSQLPMINTPLPSPTNPNERVFYHGHDELSTAWGVRDDLGNIQEFHGRFMADDFADEFKSPVVHVKWWGSYLNRPTASLNDRVRRFLISFEEDVPVPVPPPAGSFSRPGTPLLNQIVRLDTDGVLTKGEGTFTERQITRAISVDGPIFEYNAELHLGKEFPQEPHKVYWLKIVALDDILNPEVPLDQRLQWGWHNRDYTIKDPVASEPPLLFPGEHMDGFIPIPGGQIPIWHFQDDAVSGRVDIFMNPNMPIMPRIEQSQFEPQRYRPETDGPSLIANHSKDLAFQLFTVPEPSTLMLGSVLLAGLTVCRTRSRCRRLF